ncbi:ELAV-like protein 1 [Mya arenaria]|nr:ELAV-like protein 1 [Mya arenaria]XP_052789092.1 ELAV-like protein 1 [Mya arenaria]
MAEHDNPNKTNLIINYLPQTYSDDEMFTLFSTIGTVVNCRIIRDKSSGYSYGFGFVEYSTPQEAMNAIESLNGCEIENKRIKVALARPPGENTKGSNLYIRNVPHNYDEHTLQDLFSPYGNVIQTRILMDHNTGMSKGVGFVLFETKPCAEQAMNDLNGQVPPNGTQAMSIKFADDNAKKVRPPQQMGGYGGGYGQFAAPRPGGPMRGPGGSGGRMRYNPMAAGPTMSNNGYGAYSGGYQGGYAGGAGSMTPKRGMGARMGNPARGGARMGGQIGGPAAGQFGQFGAGDASTDDGFILFAYNIGTDATENDIWNLFSPYGTIKKVNVIWDHQQNKCKGYGFVTMSTLEEAKYAIEYLNGFYYKTGPLQVSLKTDKK